MEIIVSNPKTPVVLFKDISVGTGFKWREWYYMKIENARVESKEYIWTGSTERKYCCENLSNAVELNSGLLASFDPTDKIYPILMSVVADA